MANSQTINGLTISQGSYTDEVVQENSFIYNLLQKPAISGLLPLLYPKYSLSNVKNPLTSEPVEFIGDIKYRFGVLGRWEKPLTLTGNYSGTFAVNSLSYIEFYENWAQPTSTWRFDSGDQVIIQGAPQQTATGWNYPVKVITGSKGNSYVFPTAILTAQSQIGMLANKNPEFSKRGYANLQYPDWYENYLTTVRQSQEVSGTAGTAITWLDTGEDRYWIPGPMNGSNGLLGVLGDKSGGLLYKNEKEGWFGKATQDSTGNVTLYDNTNDGRPVNSGDGVYEQIPSGMNWGYNTMTADYFFWVDFVSWFKQNSGMMGAEIDVDCGIGFQNQWTKNMTKYLDQSGYMMGEGTKNMTTGRDVTVGQSIKRYYVNDVWININENPVFSDPALFPTLDATSGFPRFSYNAVFRVKAENNGVPVIQKFAKEGRELIFKTISGMYNPSDPKMMYASNQADGFEVAWLMENSFGVRIPNQIAKVYRTNF